MDIPQSVTWRVQKVGGGQEVAIFQQRRLWVVKFLTVPPRWRISSAKFYIFGGKFCDRKEIFR